MRTAAYPLLYDPLERVPTLNGVRCAQCGRVYFPPVGIGCENCSAGADLLRVQKLPAIGVVHAVATVYLSPTSTETPFTVVEVVLDSGPLIRALADVQSGDVRIGDRVYAVWTVVSDGDDGEVVEPRFVVEVSERAAKAIA